MLETGLSPNRQIQRATWKGGKVMFLPHSSGKPSRGRYEI